LRFRTQAAGVSLTRQQVENNISRTAYEAMAAVLGGTNSLHTNSMDEVLALPTERAARIALRTQQVLAHETGVANTIDPLGGSYYLEDLTGRLEAEAYDYFERIEKLGGVVAAIKDNFFQREIAEASFRYQSEVERGERIIVGVNRYELEAEEEIPTLKIDPALEGKQVERVQAVRAKRDSGAVEGALARLKESAAGEVNLMPPIALAFAVLGFGSPSDLGLVLASSWIPQIVFILIGGVWADRLPRHLVMTAANLLSGAAQAGVAVLLLLHVAQLWQLIALQVVRGIAISFFFPASQGVVPHVVEPDHLQQANALLRLSQNGTSIIGAAVGGGLVAAIGSGWAIAFDAATFFASAAILARMRFPLSEHAERAGFIRELAEG